MNNRASTPITWVIIGLLAFITIISLAIFGMNDFYTSPGNSAIFVNDTYSSQYDAAYTNITTHSDTIENYGKPTNLFDIGLSSLSAVITTAIIGIQALGNMLGLIPVITDILNSLSVGPISFTLIIGFFIAAAGVFITMKILQAVRGTTGSEP